MELFEQILATEWYPFLKGPPSNLPLTLSLRSGSSVGKRFDAVTSWRAIAHDLRGNMRCGVRSSRPSTARLAEEMSRAIR
jgi:hypothetical protein